MPNALLVKEAGPQTALQIIDCRSLFEYPTEHDGASTRFGSSSNQLAIHLTGSPSLTAADAILAAIQTPTCTSSLLDVTVNVGTYLVSDVTSIVADPDDELFAKISVAIDDTTGVLEVIAFTKTTGEYGSPSAGKTVCADLKEYSVPAAGSALSEINNFIL